MMIALLLIRLWLVSSLTTLNYLALNLTEYLETTRSADFGKLTKMERFGLSDKGCNSWRN